MRAPLKASLGVVFSAFILLVPAAARAQKQPASPVLLDAMTTELNRAFTSLGKPDAEKQKDNADDPEKEKQLPPYFLSYSVSDASYVGIRAQYGALVDSSGGRVRMADVQVRVGDAQLDNTHGTHRASAVNSHAVAVD